MPPIKSFSTEDDIIRFTDINNVEVKLLASDIPKEFNTPQGVEDYLNKKFFPDNMGGSKSVTIDPNDGKTYNVPLDYQIKVHVKGLNPLQVDVITANADVVIPDNWWSKK